MRFWHPTLTSMLLFATAAAASEPMASVKPGLSATKARDINGFALGMPIKQAAARMKVTFAQGELVEGTVGGIAYAFGVCPSGRVYRIESSQPLGRFTVDKTFTDGLGAKLSDKYGAATRGAPDKLDWDLIESVRYTDGKVHPFATNWAAAIVSSSDADGVTLNLKLLDFRVCWDEAVKRNEKPRDQASGRVKF